MTMHLRLGRSPATVRAVLGNKELRRVQLALLLVETSTPLYFVAVAVYAFAHGGAATVGLVGLVALLPAGLAAPFLAVLADRYRRERVLAAAAGCRGALIAVAAAAFLLDAPPLAIYALAALISVPARVFYPAQRALLPDLTGDVAELAAANTLGSAIENVGCVVGPALAGVLLAISNPATVTALAAVGTLAAAAFCLRVGGSERVSTDELKCRDSGLLGGFLVVGEHSELRLLFALCCAQTLLYGVFTVLLVVVAFDLTALGKAGVGLLEGAVGVGGVLAGLGCIGLGERRLGSQLGLGLFLCAFPLVLVGVWPSAGPAIALFALVGVGITCFDVALFTLVPRLCPEAVRARVFGVLMSLTVITVAVGSILAPALLACTGPRPALVASGATVSMIALAAGRRLRRFDQPRPAPPSQTDPASAVVRTQPGACGSSA
jgi:MFS family permease